MRNIVSLNGWWDWRLPGGATQKKMVPSCYHCVGDANYTKAFELPDLTEKRVILHFEGVHYSGSVTLNGSYIGDMLPYIYYDFDISDYVKEGENIVEVLIKDITAEYGATAGWEDYGGISRDVWVEVNDLVGIEDAQWLAEMRDDFASADAKLNLQLYNATEKNADIKISARLAYEGDIVAEVCGEVMLTEKSGSCSLDFSLDRVYAWSPEHPNLYQLTIETMCGDTSDFKSMDVGFSEFTAKGESFYLNGEKIFLKGVARHEIWGEHQGFTLTKDQIEKDLTLIKEMGANFVRLVHYPHSRYTVEYAAKIGLMVSEEPGLWYSDLSSKKVVDSALEIMRKTVLRDRSNPAVIAWIFFNECLLEDAIDYLKRGVRLCRSLDPKKLLSFANCQPNDRAKKVFDETGMDFYTQHPYCYEGELLIKAATELRGKPLVFTEWGGWFIHYNPNLIKLFKNVVAKLAHAGDDEAHISGMCWWEWQDVPLYSRALPGCLDCRMNDGLVDCFRNRKPSYIMMSEFFELVDRKPEPFFEVSEYPGIGLAINRELIPVDLSVFYGELNDSLWKEAASNDNIKHHMVNPLFKDFSILSAKLGSGGRGIYIYKDIKELSGLRCEIPSGHPIILRGERSEIDIGIQKSIDSVYIFGAVTFFDGYPARGKFGESIANITLDYDDGSAVTHPVRHGLETASASLIVCNSRVNAQAASAPRVAEITLDPSWEVYAVNLLTVPADKNKVLKTISLKSTEKEFEIVVYAVSVS